MMAPTCIVKPLHFGAETHFCYSTLYLQLTFEPSGQRSPEDVAIFSCQEQNEYHSILVANYKYPTPLMLDF